VIAAEFAQSTVAGVVTAIGTVITALALLVTAVAGYRISARTKHTETVAVATHDLVNSAMTRELVSRRRSIKRELTSLTEIGLLNEAAGRLPTPEYLEQLVDAQRELDELDDLIAARTAQQERMDTEHTPIPPAA
jgi:hypothetical protein